MSFDCELVPDLITLIDCKLKKLANDAFGKIDDDRISHREYMEAKSDFLDLLKLSVLSILQDKGFSMQAWDLHLHRNLCSSMVAVSNKIVLAWLHPKDHNSYIIDDVATYIFGPRDVNYGYDYVGDVIDRWKVKYSYDDYELNDLDMNQRIYYILFSILSRANNYDLNEPFELKNHKLKQQFDTIKQSMALEVSKSKLWALANKLVEKLQNYPRKTFIVYYDLESFWEEVCMQQQDQESSDWPNYESIIYEIISDTIRGIPLEEALALYLYAETESDYDLCYTERATDSDNYKAIIGTISSALYVEIMRVATKYESPALARNLARKCIDH